jgi:hypothetical protein
MLLRLVERPQKRLMMTNEREGNPTVSPVANDWGVAKPSCASCVSIEKQGRHDMEVAEDCVLNTLH